LRMGPARSGARWGNRWPGRWPWFRRVCFYILQRWCLCEDYALF